MCYYQIVSISQNVCFKTRSSLLGPSADYVPSAPGDLDQFISRVEQGYGCHICGTFSHASRSNVRNHVESKHFPNVFVYNCDVCQKTLNSKQALQQHKSKICNKIRKEQLGINRYDSQLGSNESNWPPIPMIQNKTN